MSVNMAAFIINIVIVLSIATCTIIGMTNNLNGWGYSYFLLLALTSSKVK